MEIIAGYTLVKAQERDRYVEAFRDLVERARAFEGCIDLAVTADSIDPRRINNLEIWESAEALDAWRPVSDPPDPDTEPIEVEMNRYAAKDGGSLF